MLLGHLVSVSRHTPPDFGMTTWLRQTGSRLSLNLQTILARLAEASRLRPVFAKADHLHHFAKAD